MKLLREGDIFKLKKGHKVYVELPDHLVYQNREGVFDKLSKTEVVVGQNKGGMSTDWLEGEYVVTSTAHQGGGFGHGLHDRYPNGHLVRAEKLPPKDATFSDGFYSRAKISFYQTGSFTAMIRDIEPIGRATAHWTREDTTPTQEE